MLKVLVDRSGFIVDMGIDQCIEMELGSLFYIFDYLFKSVTLCLATFQFGAIGAISIVIFFNYNTCLVIQCTFLCGKH